MNAINIRTRLESEAFNNAIPPVHMTMNTKFQSVTQMVRQTSSSKELADEFEKRSAGRTLVRKLFVLRQIKGLSQQEIAEKLGWSQSRVSKFESSDDADLRFGDIIAYLSALGLELGIEF